MAMEEYCLLPIHDDILLPFGFISVKLDADHRDSEALLSYLSKRTAKDAVVAVFPITADNSVKTMGVLPYLGRVGVLGQILQIFQFPGIRQVTLVVEGRYRLSLGEVHRRNGLLKVLTARFPSEGDALVDNEARRVLMDKTRKLMDYMAVNGREMAVRKMMESLESMFVGDAADCIGSMLATSHEEKEKLLNEIATSNRVLLVTEMVQKLIDLVETVSVKKRPLLKTTGTLRQADAQSKDEILELLEKIEKKKPPKEVLDAAHREVKRLQRTNEMHPSYGISVTYLETLASIPFNQFTSEVEDRVEKAKEELESGHHGLHNAKQRILEYVAVQKLSQRTVRGPVLCFVGPPGVGKTSLAKGMAKALGRKYVRVSLGGVRDEAEIRGHRRTYIGSMPGRIISIGVSDCVMLLDEIDKMGHDIRGNPAAALLEVLDPEQNHSFVDTYLGMPVDLSRVIFLATANTLNELPAALLDRLEVLWLTGYTIHEKVTIAKKHLIPKVVEENGLTPVLMSKKLEFPVDGLEHIIRRYTTEVGVRGLERCLSSICRHCARTIVNRLESNSSEMVSRVLTPFTGTKEFEMESESVPATNPTRKMLRRILSPLEDLSTIEPSSLFREAPRNQEMSPKGKEPERKDLIQWESVEKIVVDQNLIEFVLGTPRNQQLSPEDHFHGTGVAAGLVWTPYGGSVQYIECCITHKGSADHHGALTLTGQLGEVLEESAQIAMSWIKSHANKLGFSTEYPFQNDDVHIHLPSGGIHKDGPSAGITLAMALISLLSGRRVRSDTAMTGELSLTGLVLPVGGLKEKLIAAHQAGMKRVIIPKANGLECEHDVPEEVQDALEIYKAIRLDDVLLLAFDPPYIVRKLSKL